VHHGAVHPGGRPGALRLPGNAGAGTAPRRPVLREPVVRLPRLVAGPPGRLLLGPAGAEPQRHLLLRLLLLCPVFPVLRPAALAVLSPAGPRWGRLRPRAVPRRLVRRAATGRAAVPGDARPLSVGAGACLAEPAQRGPGPDAGLPRAG